MYSMCYNRLAQGARGAVKTSRAQDRPGGERSSRVTGFISYEMFIFKNIHTYGIYGRYIYIYVCVWIIWYVYIYIWIICYVYIYKHGVYIYGVYMYIWYLRCVHIYICMYICVFVNYNDLTVLPHWNHG